MEKLTFCREGPTTNSWLYRQRTLGARHAEKPPVSVRHLLSPVADGGSPSPRKHSSTPLGKKSPSHGHVAKRTGARGVTKGHLRQLLLPGTGRPKLLSGPLTLARQMAWVASMANAPERDGPSAPSSQTPSFCTPGPVGLQLGAGLVVALPLTYQPWHRCCVSWLCTGQLRIYCVRTVPSVLLQPHRLPELDTPACFEDTAPAVGWASPVGACARRARATDTTHPGPVSGLSTHSPGHSLLSPLPVM